MKDRVTIAGLVAVLVTVSYGQIAPTQIPTRWRWSQFPNPQNEFDHCGRNEPSYVCDPNRLVSFRGANALDSLIMKTLHDQTCPCGDQACVRSTRMGYQISVALVPEFYTEYEGDSLDRILLETRRFAYGIYSSQWSFGVCGEWVLIFYTQSQNIVYTLTGPLARAMLNDGLIEQITLDSRIYFAEGRERNITQGLIQMVEDYRDVFRGKYRRRPFVRAAPIIQEEFAPGAADKIHTPIILVVLSLIMSRMF